MRSFRVISIKSKIIGINMVASTVALLLACTTFLAYELIAYRKTVVQQLSTVAQIVSASSTAALAFDDRRSASEMLSTLRAEPNLVSACIYTRDGRPFAAFMRGESRRDLPRRPGPEGVRFENHHLMLWRRVFMDGDWVGTLYMNRDLHDMYARLERYAVIVLGVLLLSSLAALLLASRLQRVISHPILSLARTASRVSAERDYSLRAAKRGHDEIGVLVDRFNEMMGQIQSRSLDLQAAQLVLQRHVDELCNEIAERQRAQEELLSAKQAAEESSRAKSAFLANMSHELRTPLNSIIGYSEMLREDAEDAGQERSVADLERIAKAGRHLLVLINDVLDLSKIEAGKTELSWEDASVEQVLQDAAEAMAPLAIKNHNKLTMHCAPGLPPMRVDIVKFRQSLYNLVGNACKFTENGEVAVDVVPSRESGVDYIEWRVRDTGIGIAPEQMPKLFQPFSQLDPSTTRKYGGTGLGLSISRRFCELMGGTITAHSQPGKGSTFTIRLAREGRPEPPQPASPAPSVVSASPVSPARPNTVLMIDDDPVVHDMMRRTLSKEGFEAISAASGQEGLQRALELRPAAIMLDVYMPAMDGWLVLSALKADPLLQNIPVILVTVSDERQRAFLLGAADFLQKPVASEQLIEALEKRLPAKLTGPLLVVDDDPASRDMAARVLRKHYGDVMEAESGRAALRMIGQCIPGLILLDLTMPEMDGFDFIAALRKVESWRAIPIVVLTAREVSSEERKRLDGSVRRILRKGDFAGVGLAHEIADLIRGGCRPVQSSLPELERR